jgi:hypothetical protein
MGRLFRLCAAEQVFGSFQSICYTEIFAPRCWAVSSLAGNTAMGLGLFLSEKRCENVEYRHKNNAKNGRILSRKTGTFNNFNDLRVTSYKT